MPCKGDRWGRRKDTNSPYPKSASVRVPSNLRCPWCGKQHIPGSKIEARHQMRTNKKFKQSPQVVDESRVKPTRVHKEPKRADSFWEGFQERERVEHLLGPPHKIEITTGGRYVEGDLVVGYAQGKRVIVNRGHSTEGKTTKGHRYYESTPKHYTILSVTIVEPSIDPRFGENRIAATKGFKHQDSIKTGKQMTKFLKDTLGYDVSFGQSAMVESATINGVKYK